MNMANLHIAVVVLVAVYFGHVNTCDNGWVTHGPMCYLFSHDTENWIGALQVCRELGGQLVEVETAAENAFIKAQIKLLTKDQFWIALNDLSEENSWVWMNSKTQLNGSSFSDWYPGQPDNHNADQNCAAYYTVSSHHNPSWKWSDIACVTRSHYICEKMAPGTNLVG